MTDNAAVPPLSPPSTPLLTRPAQGRIIAGVCAGIAERWQVDVTLVRVVAVVLAVMSGVGVAAYLAVWLLTPSADGPAPLRAGTGRSRLAAAVPVAVAALLVLAVLGTLTHALWFGLPVGLIVVALFAAALVANRRLRIALVALVAVLAVSVAGVGVFGDRLGSHDVTVSSMADLHDRYEFASGRMTLDLSSVAVTGSRRTEVRLGRGSAEVLLPRGSNVLVHARAGVGSVTVEGTRVRGVDAEQTRRLGAASGGSSLEVDVLVGAGSVTGRTG